MKYEQMNILEQSLCPWYKDRL